jgi:hypothetical protein
VVGSVGLIFVVVAIVVGSMPDSALKSVLDVVTEPFREVVGLEQTWQIYSDVREISAYVDARVDNSDGTFQMYPVPDKRGITAFSDYRWQKYMEWIRPDAGRRLWLAYTDYLANRARAEGHDPARVTLIRHWSQTLPPGPGPARGPWHHVTMYVRDLRAPR